MKKQILICIFDGFDDWQCGHTMTAIAAFGGYKINTISLELEPVTGKSGMTVLPDLDFKPEIDLDDIDPSSTAMLILPGGDAWEDKRNNKIIPLVKHCLYHEIPVAAIGSAVVFLGDILILNSKRHTSYHPEYLKTFSPFYSGDEFYQHSPCVQHQGIITAGNDVQAFTSTVKNALDITQKQVSGWLGYFQNKNANFANQSAPTGVL